MLVEKCMTQADSSHECPHCGEGYYIERAGENQEVLSFWWCDMCEQGWHTITKQPYKMVKLTTVSEWYKEAMCYLPDEEGNFTRLINIVGQVFNDPIYAVGMALEDNLVYCLPDAPMLLVQRYCSVCQHPLWQDELFCEACDK